MWCQGGEMRERAEQEEDRNPLRQSFSEMEQEAWERWLGKERRWRELETSVRCG